MRNLQEALDSRVVIEQADHVLRGYARHHNLKLAALARSLLQGEIDAVTLQALPR